MHSSTCAKYGIVTNRAFLVIRSSQFDPSSRTDEALACASVRDLVTCVWTAGVSSLWLTESFADDLGNSDSKDSELEIDF